MYKITDREKIFIKQKGKCDICGIQLHIDKTRCYNNDYLQIDHILPQSSNTYVPFEYKRGLCRNCNSRRNNICGQKNVNAIRNKLSKIEKVFDTYLLRIKDDLRYGLLTEKEGTEIKAEVNQRMQDIANKYSGDLNLNSRTAGSSRFPKPC